MSTNNNPRGTISDDAKTQGTVEVARQNIVEMARNRPKGK